LGEHAAISPAAVPTVYQVELRKVIKALERASKDERVRGLLAHVGRREGLGGVAMVQVRTGARRGLVTL
jgi:hypothetical protein